MSNFTKMIHNVETNEIEIVELTDQEQSQLLKEREDYVEQKLSEKTQAEEKKQAALEKLAALGLELEDLKALGLG